MRVACRTSIIIHGNHPTLRFAARELARHLRQATGESFVIRTRPVARHALHLGVCHDLGITSPTNVTRDDDWIRIAPKDGSYLFAGSNPRSVLFAVYRYLEACGFRWIRPGRRGTIVPKLDGPIVPSILVDEKASYRFRTVCIEGATSLQHVRDMIDWMSKHRMNGYFIQFHLGTNFFSRWYNHEGKPAARPDAFDIQKIVKTILAEIAKRDMRLERMGHGWTCAAVGVPGEGWQKQNGIAPDKRHWLAQVNGQREFSGGIPLNTNLCYSNAQVRSALTDAVVQYAITNPQVNMLHFWLGDGMNNNCECAKCRDTRPSDFYVQILNDLDAKLTARGLQTLIVFLVYVDLLWAPLKTQLRNPSRFVLMFAPITRSYTRSFLGEHDTTEAVQPFNRNRLAFPRSGQANVRYLRQWQRTHSGGGFDFDYHGLWTCFNDPAMFNLCRVLHKDIRQLGHIGLHGMNSCQNQRVGFPHNLLMDVLASTLWNRHASFSSIVKRSFHDAFGDGAPKVRRYFQTLSPLWMPLTESVHLPQTQAARIAAGLGNLPRIRRLVMSVRPLVRQHRDRTDAAVRWSWTYLGKHLEYMDVLLPAFESYLRCADDTQHRFDEVARFLWKNETLLHPALDVYQCVSVLMGRVHEVLQARRASNRRPHVRQVA